MADETTTATAKTSDEGLVKWLLVGTTIALVIANVLLFVVELGKYSS